MRPLTEPPLFAAGAKRLFRHAAFAAALLLGSVLPGGGAQAQDVPQFQAAPKPWRAEWGSHRAVVHVEQPADVAHVRLPWRRRDADPDKKSVVVVGLADGKPVTHAAALHVTSDAGDVYFSPTGGAGDYAIYYLPVKLAGGAFPKSSYPAAEPLEVAWAAGQTTPVEAKILRWEAITAQDAFTEMELTATAEETAEMRKRFADQPFAVVLEDRDHVVRMLDRPPYRWLQPRETVLKAQPGEYCVFQLAVWTPRGAVQSLTPTFSAFKQAGGKDIPASAVTCYNTEATDWNGAHFSLRVDVPANRVQPLWCGINVPRDAVPGSYIGEADVAEVNGKKVHTTIRLEIAGPVLADGGVSQPQSLAKLQWLNSTTGISNEPTRGYTPIVVEGRVLKILGREIELGDDGLPKRITSFFNPAVTAVGTTPLPLLAGPMRFALSLTTGERALVTKPDSLQFTEQTPGRVAWTCTPANTDPKVRIDGALEFDGSLHYRISVSGKAVMKDIRLEIPRTPGTSGLAVGMGQEAGASKSFDWSWDVANKNQDSVWLGTVNGGLRLQLRGFNYQRPGVNIHYRRQPLKEPPSWANAGKGGVKFVASTACEPALLTAFSGERTLTADPLQFDFDLLVTPFHPLHTKEQWTDRYYHTNGVPANFTGYLDKAKTATANVVNVHQGNWLNPYINYPFLTADKLKTFADAAHERGLRSKYYYTVRELSNWAPELFAFRAMDNEILLHGKGGGHPWLEEHLGGDYWQAWYEPGARDVSLLTAPMSRLHNFYLEGLRWLVEHAGCDGIYLDDIAYDRAIMLRARRILDQYCPRPALIDLHSWNEFHRGGAFAQCVNLFMDSLPFVDRLWFGEGHHYDGPPAEHFLVEISGIPFGLMGEMLEGGGNAWFGLVHGCTGRMGWQGDPRPVWKLWDDFGVKDAEFIGWWADKDNPVQTGTSAVKATVWKKKGQTLLALANFDAGARSVKLTVDWAALGLSPERVKLYAPIVAPLQPREDIYTPDENIAVPGRKGIILLLDETQRTVTPDHARRVEAPPPVGAPPVAAPVPPKSSVWNNYEKLDFKVGGRAALLVKPKTPAEGLPWIWRTEFFDHEPQADIALLAKGYHVAYIEVSNLYGAPIALDAMDKFYDHLLATYKLGDKPVLEGFSRGGLYAFNWAARHPDRVAALYVDAPVCDFKSWPAGKGRGTPRPKEWEECKQAYGFTESQALDYRLNPVDNLAPLAKAGIPILSVCGGLDEVVPLAENSKLVEERYKKLGGTIKLIIKPTGKHHPHSLKDPAPIVDFILKHPPARTQ